MTAKWLSRPVFALTVEPGTRQEGGENRGGYVTGGGGAWGSGLASGLAAPAFYTQDSSGKGGGGKAVVDADRSHIPAVGELATLDFPKIERATLSNGMKVYFARRTAVPTVTARIAFDAGYAADPADKLGLQSLMLEDMDEGTTHLDSSQLAIAKERLGAQVGGFADADTTNFALDAVTPNLAASFDLLADYVRNPAFSPDTIERVRSQQLTRIDNELNDPSAIAQRAIQPVLYGDTYPYGRPPSGTGTRDVVAKLTRADLAQFHDTWLRPDNAKIFVVGDTTLAEVVRLLEASFGSWKAPAGAIPTKSFDAAIPAPKQRIILINRPASPQSVIVAGRVLDQVGTDDLLVLDAANEVFGGSFLSRINMDLRETKGWSYGVRSNIREPIGRTAFTITAPVQADRTGESVAALMSDLKDYTSGKGGHGRGAEAPHQRQYPRAARSFRDQRAGAGRHGRHRTLQPPGRLLRDAEQALRRSPERRHRQAGPHRAARRPAGVRDRRRRQGGRPATRGAGPASRGARYGGGVSLRRILSAPAAVIRSAAGLSLICAGCSASEQPKWAKTVAAFDVPLPTAADKARFLALYKIQAKAHGFHVDAATPHELQVLSKVSPITFNATVWRGEDDDEPIASAMDFRDHIGRIWVSFSLGQDPGRSSRFRESLVSEMKRAWPDTRSLPIMPSGAIPLSEDLVRTPAGYVVKPLAAAKYRDEAQ